MKTSTVIRKGITPEVIELIGRLVDMIPWPGRRSAIGDVMFENELIPGNPVSGILKRLKLERDKRITVEPMTEQEVEFFLETCFQHFRSYGEFFLCAFRTGMRLGELLGLQWSDIDWNQKFIRVERSYKRGQFDKTKTGKVRRVDVSILTR